MDSAANYKLVFSHTATLHGALAQIGANNYNINYGLVNNGWVSRHYKSIILMHMHTLSKCTHSHNIISRTALRATFTDLEDNSRGNPSLYVINTLVAT